MILAFFIELNCKKRECCNYSEKLYNSFKFDSVDLCNVIHC